MYILALRGVSLRLDSLAYIELRKQIDKSMRASFKYVIYGALLLNIMLVAVLAVNGDFSLLFIASLVSFIALVIDTVITVKGNIPVNNIINGWTPENYPANWSEVRAKWLRYFGYRQVVNIIGFVNLLIGAVFG